VAITSAPDPYSAQGRLDREAARARAGALFRAHSRMINGLCRGLLRDAAEAEDAAQQVFLSAFGALLRGGRPREPAAWLATIARNECISRIRARMREPLPAAVLEAESTQADPLSAALARADLDAFWHAVSELPPQQRSALLLREFGGLTYDELGLALGVTTPAVESLLFRARTRLRGELRAALAAVNGVGWLAALRDVLPRVLAGGGAAKVAVAAIGAGVLAGGAVVGADELLPHRSHTRAPAQGAAVLRSSGQDSTAAGVAVPPAVTALHSGGSRPERPEHRGARPLRGERGSPFVGRSGDSRRGGDGSGHDGSSSGSDGSGGVAAATTTGDGGHDGGTTTRSDSGSGDAPASDDHGGTATTTSSTTTTSGSDGGGSGADGGSGSGDSGSRTTTTATTTTTTATTTTTTATTSTTSTSSTTTGGAG
jgi:RNA polymerase sigma factor (sigma-70 family)